MFLGYLGQLIERCRILFLGKKKFFKFFNIIQFIQIEELYRVFLMEFNLIESLRLGCRNVWLILMRVVLYFRFTLNFRFIGERVVRGIIKVFYSQYFKSLFVQIEYYNQFLFLEELRLLFFVVKFCQQFFVYVLLSWLVL